MGCQLILKFEKLIYHNTFHIVVTVTSAVLMILLLLSEINNYIQPNISEDLFVDTTRSHKLKINLDLTIPRISCNCKDKFYYVVAESRVNFN